MESLRSLSSNHWTLGLLAIRDTRFTRQSTPSSNAPHFLTADMLDEARRIAVMRHSRADSRAMMTISSAILIAAIVSLVMTMLCAGMGGIAGDRTYLSCRRGLLVRSLISVLVLQPAFAVWLCYAFDLPTGVKVALLGLAIAPMPPILTSGLMRVRGSRSFEVALAFVVAVAAIATVPVSLWASWWLLDVPPRINLIMPTPESAQAPQEH